MTRQQKVTRAQGQGAARRQSMDKPVIGFVMRNLSGVNVKSEDAPLLGDVGL
jgi:hypothetical protein